MQKGQEKILVIFIILFLLYQFIISVEATVNNDFGITKKEVNISNPNVGKSRNHTEYKKIFRNDTRGGISFPSLITNNTLEELWNSTIIGDNIISADSKKYPEFNVPGVLTFNNVNLSNVISLRNDHWCETCTIIDNGSGTWTVSVFSFSNWTLIQNLFNGTFNSTSIYQSNLTLAPDARFLFSFNTNESLFTDESTYGNNEQSGSRRAGVTWLNNGGVDGNGALFFNGSNTAMTIPFDQSLNLTTGWALMTWVKFENIPSGRVKFIYLGDDQQIYTNYGIGIHGFSFRTENRFTGNNNTYQIDLIGNASLETFVAGRFYHVVSTWNGTMLKTYVNGTLTAFNETTNVVPDSINQVLTLGALNGGTAVDNLNGTLDDIKIYARALSDNEISEIYNNGLRGNIDGRFARSGDYISAIHNANTTTNETAINRWYSINFTIPGTNNITNVTVKSGNCTTLSNQAFNVSAVKSNNAFTLYNTVVSGQCLQYQIYMVDNTTTSPQIKNYTIDSFIELTPWSTGFSFYPTNTNRSVDINGGTYFMINSTDSGNISFQWYVNYNNIFNQTIIGLTNNTAANTTLKVGNYTGGDIVWFTSIAIANSVTSSGINSTNTTILSQDCGGNIPCGCGDTLNVNRIMNNTDLISNCNTLSGLIINSSNLELNCNGNSINGNYSNSGFVNTNNPGGKGLYIGTVTTSIVPKNITVKNCIIQKFATGILATDVVNLTIQNNTIKNINGIFDSSTRGVAIDNSLAIIITNNIFSNISCNTCSTNNRIASAISLLNGTINANYSNITIIGNYINNLSANNSITPIGIDLVNSGLMYIRNITIKDNIIDTIYGTNSAGILLNFENISLENNTFNNIAGSALILSNRNNKVTQDTIKINNNKIFNATYGVSFRRLYDINLTDYFGSNYTLADNLFRNSTIGIQFSNITQLLLVNNTFGNNTLVINSTAVLPGFNSSLVYENQFSSLIWNQSNLTLYNDLGLGIFNSLVISNGSIFVNSSKNNNLNKTMNITFPQISFTTNNYYIILKDGSSCSGTICSKLNYTPVTIQVTEFSNYTIISDTISPAISGLSSSAGNSYTHGITTTLSCSYSDDNPSSMTITSSDGNICSGVSSCSGTYNPTSSGIKTIICNVLDAVGNTAGVTLTLTLIPVATSAPSSASSAASSSTTPIPTIPITTSQTTTETQNTNPTEILPEEQTTITKTETTEENNIINEVKTEEQKQMVLQADQPVVELVKGVSDVTISKPETVSVSISNPGPSSGIIQGSTITIKNTKRENAIINLKVKLDEKGLEKPSLNSDIQIKELKKIPRLIILNSTRNFKLSILVGLASLIIILFTIFHPNFKKRTSFRYKPRH